MSAGRTEAAPIFGEERERSAACLPRVHAAPLLILHARQPSPRTTPSPPCILLGVHRSLGTHISKVRSATLDTWLPSQVAWAGRMGNARAAAFWEARLPPSFARPPEGDMAALSAFIGAKYR